MQQIKKSVIGEDWVRMACKGERIKQNILPGLIPRILGWICTEKSINPSKVSSTSPRRGGSRLGCRAPAFTPSVLTIN